MVRLALFGRVSALTRELNEILERLTYNDRCCAYCIAQAMTTVVYEVESLQFKRVGTSWF